MTTRSTIRNALPRWATAAQLDILTDRYGRYEWGWICGDGSAGGSHSARGAVRAARRAAGRTGRLCPAPWAFVELTTQARSQRS